ncbi:RING-8 protein [Neurospora crassa OR74A]|uniref:RING-8 protein n=1 Tax=Neurospora crassa (strain ATCC 24698 / 74-OR23-1A / CBS 708.71 / DSM 1257 / FGSC 987) TaxID=367110 RepID=Q7SHR3_NEUCR|nr:RING-8 protein [Neurospora crassa OR74A]EAA36447.2 RING-8 protein [Neurospora crassa OR74A]|eukprot:XP_965683.2 RING-8 protein [Neurospora crassa OR74A]
MVVFVNPAILEGARAVARQVAETGTSILTSTVASATASAISTSGSSSVITASLTSISPTVTPPSATSNSASGDTDSKDEKGGSSPLLFFVALGFGVVFTNLWIIVGVKYCFRYNARTRQMRLAEEGDQINLEAMPRPHRRRREKKLMTIDEVNEKFPMLKYKTWVASRARDGLPTSGGVSAPSRPNSIHDADAISRELPNKERMSTEGRPTTSQVERADRDPKTPQHEAKESTSSTVPLTHAVSEATTPPKEARVSHDEGEEEEDPIDAALPPECEGTSGDTCAICIDTLEDDDDVRGLTCGHAFHAACLDPWLTSRRACCPLCKADYYTPKPRAAGEPVDGQPGVIHVTLSNDPRSNRMNLPNRPRRALFGLGRPARTVYVVSSNDQRGSRRRHGERRRDNNGASSQPGSSPQASSDRAEGGSVFANLRAAFPHFRRSNGGQIADANSNPTMTPSNLEAGVRPGAS